MFWDVEDGGERRPLIGADGPATRHYAAELGAVDVGEVGNSLLRPAGVKNRDLQRAIEMRVHPRQIVRGAHAPVKNFLDGSDALLLAVPRPLRLVSDPGPYCGAMVLTSGVFDGLHAGHVAYLEAAKAFCQHDELLVCAVAPDHYVQSAKGHAPGWTQAERRQTVCALMAVDATIPQRQASIADLIREYRPRLLVKGADWKERLPEDVWLACSQTGTSVAFVETRGTSCTEATRTHAQDEAALTRLEALVQQQQPASIPWAPVTDYSLETRRAVEGEHPRLLVDTFHPASILDAGCGPGHLLRLLKEETHVRLAGFDLVVPNAGDGMELWIGDLAGEVNEIGTYNLVICREVLEHLTVPQIAEAVRNLCRLSDRFIYVTTRFAKTPRHVFDVDLADDLDPTHITMLTQPMLRALFVLQGMRRRPDLERQMDWQQQGRVLVYEHATA